MIGRTIGNAYSISRLLGRGGMGAVFEAEQRGTGRRVAIKVIDRDNASDAMQSRFDREARAAASIDTEHIVQVLDAGKDPATGSPYMVMEFLDGEDLGQLLHRIGPISSDLALRIAAQACIGLQGAHEAGIVHRDIKPANLFLARRAGGAIMVKLLDFGIAKLQADHAAHGDSKGLTRTGAMLGTPLYMSPEQARGTKDIDHRTDIWSLGVVLYRALAGRTPHDDTDAFGDLIVAIISELPRPLQDFAPWVHPEIAALIGRALQHDAADRYQTAAEMRAAIERLLPNGRDIRADMLVPLSDQDRSTTAPRLPAPAGAPQKRPGRDASRAPGDEPPALPIASTIVMANAAPVHDGAAGERERVSAAGGSPAAATGVTPALTSARPPRGGSKVPLAAGALAIALGGGVAYLVVPRAAPRAEVHAAPASASIEVPAPATASAQPERAPAPSAARRVKLVVYPSDVSVEIEGAAVSVRDGIVEISGGLGSVHRVRLFKGKRALEADVSITEAGAMPPKLELATAQPAMGKAPSATAAPSAKPPDGSLPAARRTFD